MAEKITYNLEIGGFERKVTGGYPTEVTVQDGDKTVTVPVVQFATKHNGRPVIVRLDTGREDLVELVEKYLAEIAEERAAREIAWEAKRAEERAVEQPLLDAMQAEEARLIAQIPSDAVRVVVTETGSLDGDPILEWTVDGVTLTGDQRKSITVIGWASATRLGALAAFESVCVAYLLPGDLAAIKSGMESEKQSVLLARQEIAAKDADILAAALETAKQTGQPTRYKATDWHMDDNHEWAYETVHYVRPDGTTYSKSEKQYCG